MLLPFTQALRKSNTLDFSWPSAEWMHGRIEGQALTNKLSMYLQAELPKAGYASIVPGLDERYWSRGGKRDYETYNEYCSLCGACAQNCPVNAISIEEGKNHPICSKFTQEVLAKHKPWYGCGKCQVMVPCESGIPIV